MRNVEKLLKTINNKIARWNEEDTFAIRGVKNLSLNDLETIAIYANEYLRSGGKNFGSLIYPVGYVGDVLEEYDIAIRAKSVII